MVKCQNSICVDCKRGRLEDGDSCPGGGEAAAGGGDAVARGDGAAAT